MPASEAVVSAKIILNLNRRLASPTAAIDASFTVLADVAVEYS
jgi:hypothetical protein